MVVVVVVVRMGEVEANAWGGRTRGEGGAWRARAPAVLRRGLTAGAGQQQQQQPTLG